jgi:hypothetical protein
MCGNSNFSSSSVNRSSTSWSTGSSGAGKNFSEALESAGGKGRTHARAHSRHESSHGQGGSSHEIRTMISSAIDGLLNSQAAAHSHFSTTLSFDPDGAGPAPEMKITISGAGSVSTGTGCGAAAGTQASAEPANDATPEAEAPMTTETPDAGPAPEETTAETAPVEAAPDDTAPAESAADDASDPIATGSVTPVATATPDCVEDETPVAETPVAETPVEETPVAETPVAETPVEAAPVEETPVAEAPVEDCPADDVPEHEVSGGGQGWGDPHFVGADGEKYDVQGEAGKTYNLLSDSGIQVNALFSTYAGNMNVMSKIGVTSGGNQIEIGTNASLSINGAVVDKDGDYLNGIVSRASGKVTVKTDEYTVQTSGSAYLDVTFSGKNVQADGVMPAGIWGVTLDGDGKPRLSGGMFGTEGGSMQGGGVLEKADGSITEKGDVTTYREYEVKDIMDLMFPTHNRFAA